MEPSAEERQEHRHATSHSPTRNNRNRRLVCLYLNGHMISIRELTNKNKRVFKRTNVCLCAYLCVISKSVFECVFFCQHWFG